MFLVFFLIVSAAAAVILAAPLTPAVGKRQELSLYGDPLTHDQIIQLIKDHTVGKRQELSLYGDPLTHDQIIQLIKDHMGVKRQELSLYGDPLTHDQIIQLIKDHIDGKRQQLPLISDPILHYQIIQLLKEFVSHKRDISSLQSILSKPLQPVYGGSGGSLLSRFQFQPNGHIDNFLSIVDQSPTWSTLINDLDYNDILNILGEQFKGHK